MRPHRPTIARTWRPPAHHIDPSDAPNVPPIREPRPGNTATGREAVIKYRLNDAKAAKLSTDARAGTEIKWPFKAVKA